MIKTDVLMEILAGLKKNFCFEKNHFFQLSVLIFKHS